MLDDKRSCGACVYSVFRTWSCKECHRYILRVKSWSRRSYKCSLMFGASTINCAHSKLICKLKAVFSFYKMSTHLRLQNWKEIENAVNVQGSYDFLVFKPNCFLIFLSPSYLGECLFHFHGVLLSSNKLSLKIRVHLFFLKLKKRSMIWRKQAAHLLSSAYYWHLRCSCQERLN